jgi:hypothetical protein
MANLIVPDTGKVAIEKFILGQSGGASYVNGYVGLYASAHTPAHTDTLPTYTAIEAAFSGYARQLLGGWTTTGLDGTFHAFSIPGAVTFTNASVSAQNVYGIFIVDNTGVFLLEAGVFDSPPIVIPAGGTLTINLYETVTSEF